MIAERTVMLAVSDGTALEARCALPATPSGGIVLGHPHPLYGGDMDNPVVVRLAEVSQDLGLATLRFNFRGVGRSTGTHGGGRHEERDLEAALTHLRAAMDGPAPLLLAGYSFGATVAARVVAGRGPGADVAGVALIAPPIGLV